MKLIIETMLCDKYEFDIIKVVSGIESVQFTLNGFCATLPDKGALVTLKVIDSNGTLIHPEVDMYLSYYTFQAVEGLEGIKVIQNEARFTSRIREGEK